ncbi:DUF1295 domain-containing protein [candidate division GN15 bacterium]|nr:DUF1295 domain-containing protein [candidate division GN15 bacterium]
MELPWLSLFWHAGLVVLGYMTLVWIVSVIKVDTSIVDIFWGLGFVVLAVFYFWQTDGAVTRSTLIATLVVIWGLRLSIYIAVRNHGTGEDPRYAKWREQAGKSWWLRSFFTVFLLQGALMWIISLPLLTAQYYNRPEHITALDIIGVVLWLAGFLFEAVGDWQLYRFKQDPANKGKVFDQGLWRYTRHPNYFGEFLIWWGYFAISVAAGPVYVAISPILMSVLVMKVSGVTLLENSLSDSKSGYREYQRRTNAFFPWAPRS